MSVYFKIIGWLGLVTVLTLVTCQMAKTEKTVKRLEIDSTNTQKYLSNYIAENNMFIRWSVDRFKETRVFIVATNLTNNPIVSTNK